MVEIRCWLRKVHREFIRAIIAPEFVGNVTAVACVNAIHNNIPPAILFKDANRKSDYAFESSDTGNNENEAV